MMNLWNFFLLGFVGCVKGHLVSYSYCSEHVKKTASSSTEDYNKAVIPTSGHLLNFVLSLDLLEADFYTINVNSKPNSPGVSQLELQNKAKLKVGTLGTCSVAIKASAEFKASAVKGCAKIEILEITVDLTVNDNNIPTISSLVGSITSALSAVLKPLTESTCRRLLSGLEGYITAISGVVIIGGQAYHCNVKDIQTTADGYIVNIAAALQDGIATPYSTVTSLVSAAGNALIHSVSSDFFAKALSIVIHLIIVNLTPSQSQTFGYPDGLVIKFKNLQPLTCHYTSGAALTVDLDLEASFCKENEEIYKVNAKVSLSANLQASKSCLGLSISAEAAVDIYDVTDISCGCPSHSADIEKMISGALKLHINSKTCDLGCLISNPLLVDVVGKLQSCAFDQGTGHIGCWEVAS